MKGYLDPEQLSKGAGVLPPSLGLHHTWVDGSRGTGHGGASLGVDDRNDFPRTGSRRLLEVHGINIIAHGGRGNVVDVGR
jgi:hypothetical protein